MANRNIDTLFFKSPFVRGLSAPLKALYVYIICDAEHTGIWIADFDIASIYIGQKVTESDFRRSFVETGKAVDLGNGKFFFPDYIAHQQPKGLKENNMAHTKIIEELNRYGLLDENLQVTLKNIDPSKGLVSPICNSSGNSNGKGSGNEEKSEKIELSEFEQTLKSFFEMRVKIKKPATERAKELILSELDKLAGSDESLKIQILNQSIRNCWQDVYPLKDQKSANTGKTPLTEDIGKMDYSKTTF